MTTRKQRQAQAHHVIDLLTDAEPLPHWVTHPDGWRKKRRNELRGEHWDLIVAELETGASVEAIVATLTAAPEPAVPAAPSPPTYEAEPWEPATPEDRTRSRSRISEIRQSLKENA